MHKILICTALLFLNPPTHAWAEESAVETPPAPAKAEEPEKAEPTKMVVKKETKKKAAAKITTKPSGLKFEELKVGRGKMATSGQMVTVHYTGWLINGTKFDSSHDRKQKFSFKLGAGQVIKGWDEGVEGMKIGGKRKLTIPPELGYGASGAGGVIPPNATLLFEVELFEVKT